MVDKITTVRGDKVTPDTKIKDLDASMRLINCLGNEFDPYTMKREPTIRDLMYKTDAELMRIPNFGRKSLKEWTQIVRAATYPEELSAEARALQDIRKCLKRIASGYRALATHHEELIYIIDPRGKD